MASSQLQKPIPLISRERSPIAVLADRRSIDIGERDIRVDDYLNDKLQIASDFANLDSLIASVESQRVQLQGQVCDLIFCNPLARRSGRSCNVFNLVTLTVSLQLEDAQSKLAKSKEAASSHTGSILQQVQSFQAQQDSIDRRLKIVTSSDVPDEAAQRFRGPMEKLRRLELARSYVELLKEVDDLTAEARKSLPHDPKEALKPYARLKQLSLSLRSLQGPAEGAAGHIVTHVDKRVTSVWEEMKKIISDEFEAVLKRSHWPTSPERSTKEWSDCFEKLLDLQTPELYSAQGPVILLPIAVMTKTFIQQFRYHFMGNRPTGSTHSVSYYPLKCRWYC